MMKPSFLALPVLVCVAACAPEPELAVGQSASERSSVTPPPPPEAWRGYWEGDMDMLDHGPEWDYIARISLSENFCWIDQVERLSAQWDYPGLGVLCTSELEYLSETVGADGMTTYTFLDHHISGRCLDGGVVDLTETSDPHVMRHAWRRSPSSTTLVSEGFVTFDGACGPDLTEGGEGGDGGEGGGWGDDGGGWGDDDGGGGGCTSGC